MRKLWGGAFSKGQHELVERFGQSLESDLRFWREDVQGSIAHARMLGAQGILSPEEADTIVEGLVEILASGTDELPRDVEDVHTAIEMLLTERIGPVAGKLHTARSRNDQVATDTRLVLRRRLDELGAEIKDLQNVLLGLGRAHRRALLPGVTHQQHAQPVTLGWHWMAYFWAFQRHGRRLEWVHEMAGLCPLGSAALAGTGFPIDRLATARALGFEAAAPNALDATSDRSYVLDALHSCALILLELSRVAQEIILWSGPEYGFVKLADSVTTGSSIMPQKRNPDMAELIRGRTGRAIGNWVALATTMKGLVMGYNRDTQEDKPALFDSLDLAQDALRLTGMMLESATWNLAKMAAATRGDFSTATDLADALAREGTPFREAHERAGRLVRECLDRGLAFDAFTESEWAEVAADLPSSLRAELRPEASAARRESLGGTGPRAMSAQLRRAAALHRRRGFTSLA